MRVTSTNPLSNLNRHTQDLNLLQSYIFENCFKEGFLSVIRIEMEQFEGVDRVQDVFDTLV